MLSSRNLSPVFIRVLIFLVSRQILYLIMPLGSFLLATVMGRLCGVFASASSILSMCGIGNCLVKMGSLSVVCL